MQSIVIKEDSRLARNTRILANEVGAETVMMDLDKGLYFGMNVTGSRIWKQLEQPMTFAQLCENLCCDFDVSVQECAKDARPFVEELVKENILFIA